KPSPAFGSLLLQLSFLPHGQRARKLASVTSSHVPECRLNVRFTSKRHALHLWVISSKPSTRRIGMTCVIDISLLQLGQLSIVGTTEHARLVLMTLPFSRQTVAASKRLTLDTAPVRLTSNRCNSLGRLATSAHSPTLFDANY